ncbi:acylphosphatase [Pseudaminobacter salicylatoxidans]|uniref:Acylphosphatase n=1 Tax=Pseudaminobacter salicylatoxidans TaxID=93369 RepID=A0A316BYC0_PSESE|nr:acylphosphatase [Pseudaminobacter salicylatoxidans]PWJ79434.1 acylphosphatase [Pseudaminobacter salicylatoxidans]
MERRIVRARVTGRVQGVSFRVWTLREAEKLDLVGWVRNEADGSVSALLAGSEDAVGAMLERLWRGPAGAAVATVEFDDVQMDELPARFVITG